MLQKLKQFVDTPKEILLLGLVVIAFIIGAYIWLSRSETAKNFLSDKTTPTQTNNTSQTEPLRIPILGEAHGTAQNGHIASGISDSVSVPREGVAGAGGPPMGAQGVHPTEHPVEVAHDRTPKPSAASLSPQTVAIETIENFTNLTLETIEQQIRLSPDVVAISRTTINGKPALGYTTRGNFSHNVAYIDGNKIYYLASQKFIPES